MKTYLHRIVLLHVFILNFAGSPAQTVVNRHYFFDMPEFAPGASRMIALNKIGLTGSNYSVLIKARLPNDTLFYTIPGHFPSGESFGYRLKVGQSKTQTDTLVFYYREGEHSIKLEEVIVYFFNQKDRLVSRRPERNFTKVVLRSYYDQRTRRGAIRSVDEQENFPSLPPVTYPSALSYVSKMNSDFK